MESRGYLPVQAVLDIMKSRNDIASDLHIIDRYEQRQPQFERALKLCLMPDTQ
jgi:hypothetical protein